MPIGKITDIEGILVGNYTDRNALTGCTVVLCPKGAVAGVDVRGSAPGTRETDLLKGYNVVERVQAILLSGGSAFGLDAAAGVMQYLEEKGLGLNVGPTVVPIVPGAVIFDLGVGDYTVRPGKEEGYAACQNASGEFETGRVGAGTGATVGKGLGADYAAEGGMGSACIELPGGVKIAALAVVNALGDIYDPDSGKIVAGAKKDGTFVPAMSMMSGDVSFGNTTIGVLATNAKLTREECNKLASLAHDGLAMAIRPVHTSMDGDTFFAMSTGEIQDVPFLLLQAAAARVVSLAILDAVIH